MDKELRRMSRGDLIDIIYQYQRREQELEAENAKLHRQLNDRDIKIQKAGSIAEAAVSLNQVFEAAQAAADQYLEVLRQRCEQVDTEDERSRSVTDDKSGTSNGSTSDN